MLVNLSGTQTPELLTLEGEEVLSMITPADQLIIKKGYVTPIEARYLSKKYPEYMGFIELIVPAVTAVASLATSIFSKKKSPQNVEASETEKLRLQLQQQEEAIKAEQQRRQQQADMMKIAAIAGIPAVLLVIMMIRKK